MLDFGCGSGTYTIPAARIVGAQGRVYALDKDKGALDELMQKAGSAGLKNIERMETSGGKIELTDESVDVVLLFDVFHSYYFPQASDRRSLGSTSKCNCQWCLRREEYFVRGSEAKCLPRPVIESVRRMLDFFPGNSRQLPSLGEVLANQPVRVLV